MHCADIQPQHAGPGSNDLCQRTTRSLSIKHSYHSGWNDKTCEDSNGFVNCEQHEAASVGIILMAYAIHMTKCLALSMTSAKA